MPTHPQGMPQTVPSLLEGSSRDGHLQHDLQAPFHVTPSPQVLLLLTLNKRHANNTTSFCLAYHCLGWHESTHELALFKPAVVCPHKP